MKKLLVVLLVLLLGITSANAVSISYSDASAETLTSIYNLLVDECGTPYISFAAVSTDGSLYINIHGDAEENVFFLAMMSEQFTLMFFANSLQHAKGLYEAILSTLEETYIPEVYVLSFNMLTGEFHPFPEK